jgi:hypothetical protein
MARDEIIALYEWAIGNCFRCARTELPTIRIGEIDLPAGAHYDVRACQDCALALEEERRRRAERTGQKYVPGQLGS